MHSPDLETFAKLAVSHDFVPVSRQLLSDTLTPVTAFRLLDDGGPICLFESVIGGEKVGRYSFLASRPIERFSAKGNQITWTKDLRGNHSTTKTSTANDPLDEFRKFFRWNVAELPGLPPFIGGAIGYAGYDVVRYVEDLPDQSKDDRKLPDLDFGFYHTLCVFDNVTKLITVVTLADCRDVQEEPQAKEAFAAACQEVDQTVESLSAASSAPLPEPWNPHQGSPSNPQNDSESTLNIESNFTREAFEAAVRTCVEYIRAGDIFQVVPSQRLTVKSSIDPFEVYRSLRVVNPSPFMFFVRTPECELVGCSPEIMCRVTDNVVTVRPLAGTRKRGKTEKEDKALEEELLADPKERAEHVMLVDLGRNDVGRVAQFGSVELTEVMAIERYSHVMHISSEVQGKLKEGLDAFDALKAALPAGTVSGAPKVRAMEIIDSLEPHRRGPYGGAVGYIDYRGNMDTCIALRTMVVQNGTFFVQAGCGVVADSDPAAEYEETLSKAKALVSAIEWTAKRCS